MRVLVTGGAGFIGSHLVDALIDAGHNVVVIDNLSTGFRENLDARARLCEADIRSGEIAAVFERERPEVVYHLAAQMNVTRSVAEPLFDAETNVLGTMRVLEAAVAAGSKRFVFASTAGAVYGAPESLPATEDTEPRPLSHYGTSKLCAENYVKLYGRLYGLAFVILRYGNVYGPRQAAHGECGVCPVLADMMWNGRRPTLFGQGACLRDYVHVRDVVRATVLAMEKGEGHTLNVATGHGVTVREIFDILRTAVGFEGEPMLAPLRAGEVENIYTSAARAESVLGWHAETPLDQGLTQFAASREWKYTQR